MPLQDAIDGLMSSDTLESVAYLTGGYLVTEQVTRRLRMQVSSESGMNVPSEVDGVLTAAAFYGYGDKVFSSDTAMMMGHGALLNTVDELSNRPAIKNLVGGAQ